MGCMKIAYVMLPQCMKNQIDSGGCCFKARWGGTKGLPPQHFIYKSQCCPPSSVQVWWPWAQIQK